MNSSSCPERFPEFPFHIDRFTNILSESVEILLASSLDLHFHESVRDFGDHTTADPTSPIRAELFNSLGMIEQFPELLSLDGG
jgi:hypothetical protein